MFANPALCTLLGRSRAELEGGAGLAGLLLGEHGCERALESALRAGEEAVLELVRRGRCSLLLLLEGAWMPWIGWSAVGCSSGIASLTAETRQRILSRARMGKHGSPPPSLLQPLRAPGGGRLWVEARLAPLGSGQGGEAGRHVVGVCLDITARKVGRRPRIV